MDVYGRHVRVDFDGRIKATRARFEHATNERRNDLDALKRQPTTATTAFCSLSPSSTTSAVRSLYYTLPGVSLPAQSFLSRMSAPPP